MTNKSDNTVILRGVVAPKDICIPQNGFFDSIFQHMESEVIVEAFLRLQPKDSEHWEVVSEQDLYQNSRSISGMILPRDIDELVFQGYFSSDGSGNILATPKLISFFAEYVKY